MVMPAKTSSSEEPDLQAFEALQVGYRAFP